ncbi:unnamed protein product [Haemonchus placei]|uniref:Transmembrane protein n=1 Tax=Haemonchus placei TaxID=6290 RepID=A0A0N4VXS6_HAEPC|nr:unnamed protein product [Haemonchus placei]
MRIEFHPVFNAHIVLESLRNVDLATRGYYQVCALYITCHNLLWAVFLSFACGLQINNRHRSAIPKDRSCHYIE